MVIQQKIEMLLLEGKPSGLRYVDIRGKTIRVFISPRSSLSKLLERPEISSSSGVYMLYAETPDKTLPQVYIGESDQLGQRLINHQRHKDFWDEVIIFTSQDETLDKAGILYLESKLVGRIKADSLVDVENDKNPSDKKISEANIAVMEAFITDMLNILVVLGYRIVNMGRRDSTPSSQQKQATDVRIDNGKLIATGCETEQGFLVYEGSQASSELMQSASEGVINLRETLIEKGILKTMANSLVFTQDYLFTSPSYAASLILGRSANGRTEWKTAKGQLLKELEQNVQGND